MTGSSSGSKDVLEVRLRLLRGGYTPLPLYGKEPPIYGKNNRRKGLRGWQKLGVSPEQLEMWERTWPDATNTGILTRTVPTLDADILNEDAACAVEDLLRTQFEESGRLLVRIGQPPKRAFLFRTDAPFAKLVINFVARNGGKAETLEFLCDGQQVVVDGIHPDTHRPYTWFGGEPGQVARAELPYVSEAEARDLIERVAELLVAEHDYVRATGQPRGKRANGATPNDHTNDATYDGYLISDGREQVMRDVVWHETLQWYRELSRHCEQPPIPDEELWAERAKLAYQTYEARVASRLIGLGTREGLEQENRGPSLFWTKWRAAMRKWGTPFFVEEAARPHPNEDPDIQAPEPGPERIPRDEAERLLRQYFDGFVQRVLAWYQPRGEAILSIPPHSGARATVGFGKSREIRRAVASFVRKAKRKGLPHRVLILVPTHRLGKEVKERMPRGITSMIWQGRLSDNIITGKPMCANHAAVNAALAIGAKIQKTACRNGAARCRFFSNCSYQRQKKAANKANVIISVHELLFNLPEDLGEFGMVIVDESFWRKGVEKDIRLAVKDLDRDLDQYPVCDSEGIKLADDTDYLRDLFERLPPCVRESWRRSPGSGEHSILKRMWQARHR